MCVDFGDAYIVVCTNYMHSFSYVIFQFSLCVLFYPSCAKCEVCVHDELLSSLRSATCTQYTATLTISRSAHMHISSHTYHNLYFKQIG